MYICGCVHEGRYPTRPESSTLLGAEGREVVNCLIWVLGIKFRSNQMKFGRAPSFFHCGVMFVFFWVRNTDGRGGKTSALWVTETIRAGLSLNFLPSHMRLDRFSLGVHNSFFSFNIFLSLPLPTSQAYSTCAINTTIICCLPDSLFSPNTRIKFARKLPAPLPFLGCSGPTNVRIFLRRAVWTCPSISCPTSTPWSGSVSSATAGKAARSGS